MKKYLFILLITGVFFIACKQECKVCWQEKYGVSWYYIIVDSVPFLDSSFTMIEVTRQQQEYCNEWDFEYLENKEPEYEWADSLSEYDYYKYEWICQ